ncbi:hypothetical protein OG946_01380 [Streptomyces sp. NBC_01808]|uniref:hypothetical protein n=1 Tax=Streptomyces sp. NBC_01808 TaxID=2975947 RepID=UPI002DD9EA72|nr:hypothetical protein [Streptomyces sp. NBC_01808]WSA36138.1 hypothetical protein OG946_01380 [Streptomyces sp. NBC_01808]
MPVDVLPALAARRPVDETSWHDLWERAAHKALRPGEAVGVVASLSTRLPDADSVVALLDSLDARRGPLPAPWPGTVNPVGTGGGPATFDVATAAALLAAAMGIRVVKTGSCGCTGRSGSLDTLERLGIATAASYAECEDMLAAHGIAFAGGFVHPVELTSLERAILPYGMEQVGGAVHRLGPFLAAIPVTAQVTGVTEPGLHAVAARIADSRPHRALWLTRNDLGADKLLSFAANTVRPGPNRSETTIAPGFAGGGHPHPGTLADLRPAGPGEPAGTHLLALLRGEGPAAARETVCLNAAVAALAALAAGADQSLAEAFHAAEDALRDGAAVRLVERLRARRGTESARQVAGVRA